MAEERVKVAYSIDPKNNEIHRKKISGEDLLEDKIVAVYEPDSQTVTFPDQNHLRLYKRGVITFLSEDEKLVKSFQRGDLEPDAPLTKNIPPRPKKNKTDGDKTKAVVEWYHKYKPNEFATRYGVLGTYSGMVSYLEPQWVPRPVDRVPEYRGESRVEKEVTNAIVALRKTHLTYLPEECVDWDEEDPEFESEGYEPAVPVAKGSRRTEEDES
jgi:hypothetical protein